MLIWRQYTATAGGAVVKPATCEECGTEYVYRVERMGEGQGTSLYMVDNQGAQRRANEAAEKALAKELEKAIEVVPCPKCGCVQEDMVKEARRRHLGWMGKPGWFLVFGAVAFGVVNWASGAAKHKDPWVAWPTFALFAAIGPVLLVVRAVLRAQHDPNTEDREARLEWGRSLALTRADYEKLQREEEAPDA